MAQLHNTATQGRRVLLGSIVAICLMAILGAVMFALRSHLGDATVALVLVVPVVVGVMLGGATAGAISVVAGLLLYDLVFIPPYYTLTIGSARDWVAVVVYVVVVSLVARVVDRMQTAQQAARAREADTQRLLELSQLLLEDRPLTELLPLIVSSAYDAFGCEAVVLLLPRDARLEVVASAGRDLTQAELERIAPPRGLPASLTAVTSSSPGSVGEVAAPTETLVLASPGHPVGLLGLVGTRFTPARRAMAAAFANHGAIAIERAELQARAHRTGVLEEVDRLRGSLVAAVSHDLRTPLTTIKASASALLDPTADVPPADRQELLALIDTQADRLGRLVSNLLDMSRIETGALAVYRQALDVSEVVNEAVQALRPLVEDDRVDVLVAATTPAVQADHVLTGEILVNLLENALRYAPEGTKVRVDVAPTQDGVTPDGEATVDIAVSDEGPGIPEAERAALLGLGRPVRPTAAGAPPGGSGVGLTIARVFAEVQGGRLRVDTAARVGARIVLSLPAVK